MNAALYTATDLARALALPRQTVQSRIGNAAAAGQQEVCGRPVEAWALESLPASLTLQLRETAAERGFPSVHHFLTGAASPWEPPRPLDQVADKFRQDAMRRRQALAPFLPRQLENDREQLQLAGLAAYQRIFGHPISAKTWWRWMERVTSRDGGAQNWQRLELYIEDSAFLAAPAPAPTPIEKPEFHYLGLIFAEIQGAPNREQKAHLWAAAFQDYEELLRMGTYRPAKCKQAVIGRMLELFPCPILLKSPSGFKRSFDRKLDRWRTGGRLASAIMDERRLKSGRPTYDCAPCFKLVNHTARNLRGRGGMGNMAEAWRQLWRDGQICATCRARYAYDVRKNGSYVPRTFRRKATPNKMELAKDRGWKHARDIGPSIPRDWSDTEPGDWFVLDDETSNHIVYDYIPGQQAPIIGVVQNLEAIDLRCDYPLDFLLYFGAPSGLAIRKLLWQVMFASGIGLPDEGLMLERGVFKSSMVAGKLEDGDRPWSELEDGLKFLGRQELGIRQAGLRIHHARVHRAKTIEGYFHMMQKMGSGLPGFRGFKARQEIPDSLKDFIALCKSGKEHPANKLLSIDELRLNYCRLREEFRNRAQHGKRLRGATPAEMWQERIARKPLRQLPPQMEYLVSSHKRPVSLTERGIKLHLAQYEDGIYCSPELGEWYGRGVREVLAWICIFNRERITVTDMKGENPLSVARLSLPATTATKEQIGAAQSMTRGQIALDTERFGNLSQPLIHTIIRDNAHTPQEKALGKFHNAAERKHKAESNTLEKEIAALHRQADRLGMHCDVDLSVPRNRQGFAMKLKGLKGLQEGQE